MRGLGCPSVAAVAASHVDIRLDLRGPVTEEEVVYLADKLVKEDRVVGLEERYRSACERFAQESAVLALIDRRFENARLIKARVEQAVGMPLAGIIEG